MTCLEASFARFPDFTETSHLEDGSSADEVECERPLEKHYVCPGSLLLPHPNDTVDLQQGLCNIEGLCSNQSFDVLTCCGGPASTMEINGKPTSISSAPAVPAMHGMQSRQGVMSQEEALVHYMVGEKWNKVPCMICPTA